MSKEQKEQILKEIVNLKPADKAFVMGYCAHAANSSETSKKK